MPRKGKVNMDLTIVTLKKGEGRTLKAGGMWVYDNEIESVAGSFVNGDIVEVHDFDGYCMGCGYINTNSKITVRLLSRKKDVTIDEDFMERRVRDAWAYRKQTIDTSSCRIIFGEADFLPGIVVDKFSDVLVVESLALGIDKWKHIIVEKLKKVLAEDNIFIRGVYERSDAKVRLQEGMERSKGFIGESFDTKVEIVENGVKYVVDVEDGQKTGFFVDQRDNRELLRRYSAGRRVLNMFCYTGGFSVYSLAGGAESVHSVDSSAKAVSLTDANVSLNFDAEAGARHRSYAEDAFKFLDNMEAGTYDLIVLDPPAFAKHRGAIRNALRGYQRINFRAFEKIAPGGLLFTFSCSQAISKEQFRLAVFSAAAQSGRRVRILHQLTQPADHPVNIYHPEGEYLKGLVLYVE